ncbi:hypothetical protein [Staphylococcus pseudintermedius]|nr:hypothetical protein [Staphylococcus pseudintermedius]POY96713.1 hypothetical protein CVM48_07555 [Staphylococcus pseudintermedius]
MTNEELFEVFQEAMRELEHSIRQIDNEADRYIINKAIELIDSVGNMRRTSEMEISLAETREFLNIVKRVTPVLTREEFEMVGLIYLGALERLENNMEDTNND